MQIAEFIYGMSAATFLLFAPWGIIALVLQ